MQEHARAALGTAQMASSASRTQPARGRRNRSTTATIALGEPPFALRPALAYTYPGKGLGMLTVSEVRKAYGGKVLFDDVTTTFDPGKRYGLTGANGAGKSTFMKIIAGLLEPDEGNISIPPNARMSMLHQDHYRHENDRIRDVVLMGNQRLWEAMDEKEKLLAGGDFNDEIGMKLGELEVVIAEEDGYNAENEAEQILTRGDLDLQAGKDRLIEIRSGEWTQEQVESYFEQKEKELDVLYEQTKLIPHSPDEAAIKELLLESFDLYSLEFCH